MAAALAHAAVAFKHNPELSERYWSKAKQAFSQTGAFEGNVTSSREAYPVLQNYYNSQSPWSHVFFGTASMWVACKALCDDEAEASLYRELANELADVVDDQGPRWYWEQPGWDNAWWDAAMIMAQEGETGPTIDGNTAYPHFLNVFVNRWVNGEVDAFSPIRYDSPCYSTLKNGTLRFLVQSTVTRCSNI